MGEQGCSTLAADEDGRALDRLAGLEKVISPDMIQQALRDTGRVNGRACPLTHEVMLWLVLAQGVLNDLPIREVFRQSRRRRPGSSTEPPPRSSLCVARQRLGVEPLQALHSAVVRPLAAPKTPGAFHGPWRLMGIDGVVCDVPDSEANASFGRASGGRGEGAFPQVRKVSLVELGTHVETAIALGGWGDDERTLARQLFNQIPPDALLLEDRGFFSYNDWKALDSRCKLLVRVKSNFVLKPIRVLSDGSYLAKVYRTSHDRAKDRDGILVRVIEYTLDDPQRTGHGEVHRLLTNVLDETELSAREAIVLYHERWEEELVFDEQKTHQHPRRVEKPAHVRSETPAGVKQEFYALSLAHFVLRKLMFEAAQLRGLDTDRISFLGCIRILKCRLPECDTRTPARFAEWYQALLEEVAAERVEPRRNRVNPRVIKRKMSKWPKKRPAHRHQRPLLKTFEQCVVMKT